MDMLSSVLIAGAAVIFFAALLYGILSIQKKNKNTPRVKNRVAIIRDATRKLSQNPHHVGALKELSDLYYQEHSWEKAYPLFDLLLGLASSNKEIDLFQVALRQGICALKLNKPQDALQGLMSAVKLNSSSFEALSSLAQAYYQTGDYEHAVLYFKKALVLNQDAGELYELLGLSLYNLKRYRDSLPYLRRALTDHPEQKEVLYAMADAMQQTGFGEKALKVFMHLRPDPDFGARSCLAAGVMHMNTGGIEKAVQDFEIGLKHVNVPQDILLEIKYRLATCYIQLKDIDGGLQLLREILVVNPSYRDVPTLVSRYQELKQNTNLQIYLTAGNSDFVALCRKIVIGFYGRASVKILDINVSTENTEVLTEVETSKWEDVIMFRFYRTTGAIGELHIRDFHGRLKDVKAGRGVCLSAGSFSDEARNYTEGRPIDLIDKTGLIKILKSIDSRI